MGASASTISAADFSEIKALYETKKAEGLSDEELFTQIKATLDAKHHASADVTHAPVAAVDVPVDDHTVLPTEIAVA